MEEPLFIENQQPNKAGLDYQYLRAEGIRYIQELAGEFWTDFNEHDPGVTILEQICYVLTDLSYRTDFDIQNHLFSSKDADQSFLMPNQIFPCNALTLNDYRKQIFDLVFEVKNVWFMPVESDGNSLSGLYKVLLDVDDDYKDEESKHKIIEKVKDVFCGNRNLCEDIEQITILENELISVHASVEIDVINDLESILAKIYFKIEEYLNPPVRFYSFDELLDEGYNLNEVFNGPLLKHGFIKSKELHAKSDKILISDIIKIMMQVEGVKSVKDLCIKIGDQKFYKQVDIDEGKLPKLIIPVESQDEAHTIQFYRGNTPYNTIDLKTFKRNLNELKSANRRVYRLSETKIDIPRGVNLNIDKYYSLQNHFPIVYGIGKYGIPGDVTKERIAQTRQLKGFLMLFEQILANHLSQLAHAKDLFSISKQIDKTYFYQTLNSIPDVEPLYKKDIINGKNAEEYTAATGQLGYKRGLSMLVKSKDNYIDRRNRFLDYLLAIHGEVYAQYSLAQFNYYFDDEGFNLHMIENKTRLLQFLPFINRNRAKAFNFREERLDINNTSGMEVKVKILLGLTDTFDFSDKKITNKKYSILEQYNISGLQLINNKSSQKQKKAWEDGKKMDPHVDVDSIYFSENFDHIDEEDIKEVSMSPEKEKELIKKTLPFRSNVLTSDFLREGIILNNYRVGPELENPDVYHAVFKKPETSQWLHIGRFANMQEAIIGIQKLILFLKETNMKNEGLHFVEHILLRPDVKDKKFGIYLLDEEGDEFLMSVTELYTFKQRQKVIKEIRKHISTYSNYSVEARKDRDFEIHFQTPEGVKFVSTKKYVSVQEIHKKMEALYNFLSDKNDIKPYEEKVGFYIQNGEEETPLSEDFYSYRISVILPNWTARFHNPEFRTIVEETIDAQRPANVASKCIWVNIQEMNAFEKVYFDWMNEKALKKPSKNKLDKLAASLTRLLMKYRVSEK